MKNLAEKQEHATLLGVFGIGILLLVIAIFFDPIGASPDTGVFDFGATGTKGLLGGLGIILLVCGFGLLIKARRYKSK